MEGLQAISCQVSSSLLQHGPRFATCLQTFNECSYGCKTALVAGAANGSANGGAGSGAAAYVMDTLLQVAPGAALGAGAYLF